MVDDRFTIEPLGDQAFLLRFCDEPNRYCFDRIRAFDEAVSRKRVQGIVELSPAYTSLAVYYDPLLISALDLEQFLRKVQGDQSGFLRSDNSGSSPQSHSLARELLVPVCYDLEFGHDLEFVASSHGMNCSEVVEIHTAASYFVHMIGFLPGFPYLGGLSSRIATPRKSSPRLQVPAGSVGIAGNQTGIYPIDSPGGWQIIGRSPWQFFNLNHTPPSKIQAGDTVRFVSIGLNEFREIQNESIGLE